MLRGLLIFLGLTLMGAPAFADTLGMFQMPAPAFSELSIEQQQGVLAVCIIVGVVCLFALLPDFDGTQEGDWDVQEGDDRDSERWW